MQGGGTNSLRKLRRDWWKTRLCTSCVSPLGRIISRGGICPQCGLRVCKNCRSELQPGSGIWVCVLCSTGNDGMTSDNLAIGSKSLGRDSRSIRRSWTISNPQRAQTNSPVLKSYTILHPEESGSTLNPTSNNLIGNNPTGTPTNQVPHPNHHRQFHSLPRMNSESERSKKIKRSFNSEFEKENIKRHRSFQTTLHPYQVPNPPSPSASINFIEDPFWDYYDYEIEDSPSGSPRAGRPGASSKRLLSGMISRRGSARSNGKPDSEMEKLLNMRTNSNRSSCERSLGETYDYDYSLKNSYNTYNSLSDTELNDNSKYDQEPLEEQLTPRRFSTESSNFYRFATITPINMSPVINDPRRRDGTSGSGGGSMRMRNVPQHIQQQIMQQHHQQQLLHPVKPERRSTTRNRRSISLNSYDGKRLFSPLRTYMVLMKENVVPKTHNISDSSDATTITNGSTTNVTENSSSSGKSNTSSVLINSTSKISPRMPSSFSSNTASAVGIGGADVNTKYHSLPRERVIRIEREDWRFSKPSEIPRNEDSNDINSNKKKKTSIVEISRSPSTASVKGGKNTTRVPIGGNRIVRSQSYREISNTKPVQGFHEVPVSINLRSSPDGTTAPTSVIRKSVEESSGNGGGLRQRPFFDSLLDDRNSMAVMENFLKSNQTSPYHHHQGSGGGSGGNGRSNEKPSRNEMSGILGATIKDSASKKSDFLQSKMSDFENFQREQIQTFDNYLRQCSTFPRALQKSHQQQEQEGQKPLNNNPMGVGIITNRKRLESEPTVPITQKHTSTTTISSDDNHINPQTNAGIKQYDSLDAYFHPIGRRKGDLASSHNTERIVPIVVVNNSGSGGGPLGPGWSATLPHPYIRKHKQQKTSFLEQQNQNVPTRMEKDRSPSIDEIEREIERDIYFQKTKSLDRARPSRSRPSTSLYLAHTNTEEDTQSIRNTKEGTDPNILPPVASPRLRRKAKLLLASNPNLSSSNTIPKINTEQSHIGSGGKEYVTGSGTGATNYYHLKNKISSFPIPNYKNKSRLANEPTIPESLGQKEYPITTTATILAKPSSGIKMPVPFETSSKMHTKEFLLGLESQSQQNSKVSSPSAPQSRASLSSLDNLKMKNIPDRSGGAPKFIEMDSCDSPLSEFKLSSRLSSSSGPLSLNQNQSLHPQKKLQQIEHENVHESSQAQQVQGVGVSSSIIPPPIATPRTRRKNSNGSGSNTNNQNHKQQQPCNNNNSNNYDSIEQEHEFNSTNGNSNDLNANFFNGKDTIGGDTASSGNSANANATSLLTGGGNGNGNNMISNGKSQSSAGASGNNVNNPQKAVRFEPHIIEMEIENERRHNKASRSNSFGSSGSNGANVNDTMRMNNFNNKLQQHLITSPDESSSTIPVSTSHLYNKNYNNQNHPGYANNKQKNNTRGNVHYFSGSPISRKSHHYSVHNHHHHINHHGGSAKSSSVNGDKQNTNKTGLKSRSQAYGFVARALAKVKGKAKGKSNVQKSPNAIAPAFPESPVRSIETRDSITYISPPPTEQQQQQHNSHHHPVVVPSILLSRVQGADEEITPIPLLSRSDNQNQQNQSVTSGGGSGNGIIRAESFNKSILKHNDNDNSGTTGESKKVSFLQESPQGDLKGLARSPEKPKRSVKKMDRKVPQVPPPPPPRMSQVPQVIQQPDGGSGGRSVEEDETKYLGLTLDQLTPSSSSSSSSSSFMSNLQESYDFFHESEECESIEEDLGEYESEDEDNNGEQGVFKSFEDDEDACEDFIFYSNQFDKDDEQRVSHVYSGPGSGIRATSTTTTTTDGEAHQQKQSYKNSQDYHKKGDSVFKQSSNKTKEFKNKGLDLDQPKQVGNNRKDGQEKHHHQEQNHPRHTNYKKNKEYDQEHHGKPGYIAEEGDVSNNSIVVTPPDLTKQPFGPPPPPSLKKNNNTFSNSKEQVPTTSRLSDLSKKVVLQDPSVAVAVHDDIDDDEEHLGSMNVKEIQQHQQHLDEQSIAEISSSSAISYSKPVGVPQAKTTTHVINNKNKPNKKEWDNRICDDEDEDHEECKKESQHHHHQKQQQQLLLQSLKFTGSGSSSNNNSGIPQSYNYSGSGSQYGTNTLPSTKSRSKSSHTLSDYLEEGDIIIRSEEEDPNAVVGVSEGLNVSGGSSKFKPSRKRNLLLPSSFIKSSTLPKNFNQSEFFPGGQSSDRTDLSSKGMSLCSSNRDSVNSTSTTSTTNNNNNNQGRFKSMVLVNPSEENGQNSGLPETQNTTGSSNTTNKGKVDLPIIPRLVGPSTPKTVPNGSSGTPGSGAKKNVTRVDISGDVGIVTNANAFLNSRRAQLKKVNDGLWTNDDAYSSGLTQLSSQNVNGSGSGTDSENSNSGGDNNNVEIHDVRNSKQFDEENGSTTTDLQLGVTNNVIDNEGDEHNGIIGSLADYNEVGSGSSTSNNGISSSSSSSGSTIGKIGSSDLDIGSEDSSSDWHSESTKNTVIFRGKASSGGDPLTQQQQQWSPSSETVGQGFNYNCDPEIHISSITLVDNSSGTGSGVTSPSVSPNNGSSIDTTNLHGISTSSGIQSTETETNVVSAEILNKSLDDKDITGKNSVKSSLDRPQSQISDSDCVSKASSMSGGGGGDSDDNESLKNNTSQADYNSTRVSSPSSITALVDSSEELAKSNETLTEDFEEEAEEPLVEQMPEDSEEFDTEMVTQAHEEEAKLSHRYVPSNNKGSTAFHQRRESPEGQEQEVPSTHPSEKDSVSVNVKDKPKKALGLNEVIIMEEKGGSSKGLISKSKISQNVLSQITSASSRSSPDGADAERSEGDSSTTEPDGDSPTPMIEHFDVTSDEDSWVEEIIFEDDDTDMNNSRKPQPPPLDLTLHTIVEESCEESEAENSGNFNQQPTTSSQRRYSHSQQNDNELEKYFNFGIYNDNGSQGGRNSLTNEESEFSDTFSESSFSIHDDQDLQQPSGAASDGHGDRRPSNSSGAPVDPAVLASSRLEKYFYNLGLPQSMINPISSINQTADSDSVGSESESDNSVLENRKKVLKHHRRSADFEDEFGDKVSDEEEDFGFGQDGFDTIKKTARKVKKSGSEGNLLESSGGSSATTTAASKSAENLVGGGSGSSSSGASTASGGSPGPAEEQSSISHKTNKTPVEKSLSNSGSSGASSKEEQESSSASPTSPSSSRKSGKAGEKEKPVIKVNRSNSFTWSSDEEVNIMMSKLRQLIRNLTKSKMEANANATEGAGNVSSTTDGAQTSTSSGANPTKDKDKQLAYLENELIRLMKSENLKNIVEYFSSEESDVDDVYKFIKVVKESGSNVEDNNSEFGDLEDLDLDDPNLLQTLQTTMQGDDASRMSPKGSPALLAKVMHHIGNRLAVWMKDENLQEDDTNDDNATLKCAQSVSSDLNEDRFSWKGSFESALAAKRQSVGSTDSISSSDFTQDRSILRSSSLHHLANSSHHLGQLEENKEEEETASSLPRMTNLCNSLPRLNQPSNLAISRAHSLVMSGKGEGEHAGPVKSARYRPPGFQPVKSKRMDDEGKNSPILSQSTPVLTQDPGNLKVRSDSMGSIFHDAKPHICVKGQVEFGLQYNYKLACLEVQVKQCRDLAAVDNKRNRSDPYVKAYLLPDRSKGGKRKTKTKKNTLHPIFDEILKFPLTLSDLQNRTLWLSVWHSDIFGKNEFLGEVLVDLKDRVFDDPNPQLWDLQEMSGQTEDIPRGDVVIALKWQPKTENTGNLSVLVKEAKNLAPVKNGSPSTFIKCMMLSDKSRKHKTSICRRSYNPVWNQTLTFEEVDDDGIEITLWNHDLLSNHDLLGTIRVDYDNPLWESMLSRHSFWVEGVLRLT